MPARLLPRLILLFPLSGVCIVHADDPAYVGSTNCAECHEEQYNAWLESDHRHAMHPPTSKFVRGAFDGSTLVHFNRTSTFRRDEHGKFIIETDDAGGATIPFELAYTFGWQPLQQFLIQFPDGRYQVSHLSWDTERNEWFHHYPEEEMLPGDPLHWTGPLFTWNRMCAECHTVDLRKNYDLETDTYDTQFAELGVGCESCHGAAGKHVELMRSEGEVGPPPWGLLNPLKEAAPAQILDSCFPCHSRRSPITSDWKPGDPFLDHYAPELIIDPLYYPDGQILDEVFVYGSFMQSRMAMEGVTCNDCHEPHSLRLDRPGNATCTSCHEAVTYDRIEHHHHERGTSGAECIECHMPSRNYMVVDPRRDHRFGSPRPDLTLSLGVPNACNGCHADQTPAWAEAQWREWYGEPDPSPFAGLFDGARNGSTQVEAPLAAVVENPEIAPMLRATAAFHLMPFAGEESVEARLNALRDPSPLVRAKAARSLTPPAFQAPIQRALQEMLDDPVRLVRIEAVRPLTRVDRSAWTVESVMLFDRALEEAFQAEHANADHPASHLNRGALLSALGRFSDSEAAYRMALRLDPTFIIARYDLAILLYHQGRLEETEQHFRMILDQDDEQVEVHFSLGLLLAETEERRDEALDSLKKAVALDSERDDIQYNLGLLYLELGDAARARVSLEKAQQLQPEAIEYPYALLSVALGQRDWAEALRWMARLRILDPENPDWPALEDAVREQTGG